MDASLITAFTVRQYDGSKELRSLADVLATLQDLDDFSERETATIRTFGWSLRKGVDLAFSTLLGPVRADRRQLAVHLPPCCTFSAKTTGGVRETFGIALLHEAVTDHAAVCRGLAVVRSKRGVSPLLAGFRALTGRAGAMLASIKEPNWR